MNSTPYVPFYTSDFLAGTSGMTAATKGVYITLLCLMYEAEAPLSQKWDALARRCGCALPAFRSAISNLECDGKIEVCDGSLWSSKCEKHIAKRRERQSCASAAASKRWRKSKEKQSAIGVSAMPSQYQPEPEPEPEIEKERDKSLSKNRGTRLPADWSVSVEMKQWAASEGLTFHELQQQTERFQDYWTAQPGQKGVKLDWNATFRNWIRRYIDDRSRANNRYQQNRPTTQDPRAQAIAGMVGGFLEVIRDRQASEDL